MTAQHLAAATRLSANISAQRLLEGLSRLYRWIVVTDASRCVLWRSEGLAELMGADEFAIGDDLHEFIPKLPRPEQIFPLRKSWRNDGFVGGVSLELRKKDGSVVAVELHLLTIAAEGSDPLLVGIARPLDSLPGRAAGLAQSIVDHMADAVLALDREGFVLEANAAAAALLERPRDELVGAAAALLFGRDASEAAQLASSLTDARTTELSLLRSDGTVAEIRATSSDLAPDFDGTLLVLRDPSLADRTLAELERANDELEHCVNALAHDLRSPLVALLGFSRLLRQDYEEILDDAGKHFLDRIEQAGRTMEGLIHDLLELSRIGQPGEQAAMVDPRAVLLQLKAELKPRLEAQGIALVLPDPPPPLVYCERTRLYQLLSNLIGNAIDHMGEPEAPRIEVRLIEQPTAHEFVVSDNGQGIASEHHEQIFEVFRSLSKQRRGRSGAGIGLAIVKKVAEAHGGRVWVESAPNQGAAFHVLLPRS